MSWFRTTPHVRPRSKTPPHRSSQMATKHFEEAKKTALSPSNKSPAENKRNKP
jgi:hypothetical protein